MIGGCEAIGLKAGHREVLAGINNHRFKVSQTLPRPLEEQFQITDLIGECLKMGLSQRTYAALRESFSENAALNRRKTPDKLKEKPNNALD